MPGADADFAAYLAARWPSLVRTLVFLGCGRAEAAQVAQTGMAGCHHDWERVRRDDDLDAYVYGLVVARLHRHRRRHPQLPVEPLPDDATDDEVLCQELLVDLERLDVDEREMVVLRFVAELSEAQVADALDVPLESAQARITHGLGRLLIATPLAEAFRRASESIVVPTTPVDEVVAEARDQVRHRRRVVAASVAVAAVVLAGITWVSTRDSPPSSDPAPTRVQHEKNPVRVAWYADGRLHLDHVVVTVPAVADLVEVNGGVVYGDSGGNVAFVAADGKRRVLGDKSPSPLVASPEDGWVAWVDPGSDGGQQPTLVVYDVTDGRLLDALGVSSGDVRPIAIDQHRIFYEESDGSYAWTPGAVPRRLDRDGLLDVVAANRVYQQGPRIAIEQGFFNVSFVRPGTGAQLSDGGILVLSKAPGPGVDEGLPFRPLLYDARSGDRKSSGVGPEERAVDATFGRNNTAVYLVGRADELRGNAVPLLVLRSCDLSGSRCTDVAPIQLGTDRPVLAH